jgi:hypothetical protein
MTRIHAAVWLPLFDALADPRVAAGLTRVRTGVTPPSAAPG